MPRPPRIEYPHAFYHVFSRGNRRAPVFHNTDDLAYFEKLLRLLVTPCNIHLYAWCLMPNHFHLLIETPNANLSIFMRRLLTRYAKYFNRAHGLVGHVFQGRYKALLCQQETYFKTLLRYIHRNPIAGKKGKSLVKQLADWPWSSHRFYSGAAPLSAEFESTITSVMRRFGDSDSACKNYSDFIHKRIEKEFDPMALISKGKRIFGDDIFIEQVKETARQPVRRHQRLRLQHMNIEAYVAKAASAFNVRVPDIQSPSRTAVLNRARKIMAFVGREYFRFPVVQLGKVLGRDATAVSHMIERGGESLKNAPGTAKLLEFLGEL